MVSCKGRTICDTYKGLSVCIPSQVGPPELCFVNGMLVREGQCHFPQCTSHMDCKDRICLFGECQDWPRGCYDSLPCPPGMECKYGICFSDRKSCTDDSQCQLYADAFCSFGFCIPRIYKGCPAGMSVGQDGFCRVKICKENPDCGVEEKCARGQADSQGICIEISKEPPEKTKCSFGEYRANGQCVRIQCTEDSHCTDKKYCRLGFCRPRVPDCSYKIRQA